MDRRHQPVPLALYKCCRSSRDAAILPGGSSLDRWRMTVALRSRSCRRAAFVVCIVSRAPMVTAVDRRRSMFLWNQRARNISIISKKFIGYYSMCCIQQMVIGPTEREITTPNNIESNKNPRTRTCQTLGKADSRHRCQHQRTKKRDRADEKA